MKITYKILNSMEKSGKKGLGFVKEFYNSFEQSRNILFLIMGKDLRDTYV